MAIFYLILLLVAANTTLFSALHLTNEQLGRIDRLVRHPKITQYQRNRINHVLYRSYEKWAVKRAHDFRRVHRNKCRNIAVDDLVQSSKIGLYRSIKNYNGKYAFLPYSMFYVKGELFNTVTRHYAGSMVPRTERIRNKSNYSAEELADYNARMETPLVGYVESWLFSDIYGSNGDKPIDVIAGREVFERAWTNVNKLDGFTQRVMQYKYGFEFNRIRSNREIAELMACSEEKVRQSVLKGILHLKMTI